MGKYYDDEKAALHQEIELACQNIDSAPSANFANEITNLTSSISSLNLSSWRDQAKESYDTVQESVISKLELVANSISATFASAEKTYQNLNLQLQELQTSDEEYQELLRQVPNPFNYRVPDESSSVPGAYKISDEYYTRKGEWDSAKENLENQCKEMITKIDEYLELLKQVDNLGISGDIDAMILDLSVSAIKIFDNSLSEQYLYGNLNSLYEETFGITMLKDEELETFRAANGIPEDIHFIGKSTEVINGVEFDTYFVFDNEDFDNNDRFLEYYKSCCEKLGRVDTPILQKIRDNNTSLVFEQTYECDNGSLNLGYFNLAAYCNSANRNIVMFNHNTEQDEWAFGYYTDSIVHECGHAYDFTLAYEKTGELYMGISQMEDSGFQQIAAKEASLLKDNIDEFSTYSLEDLQNRPIEFFAECFKEYYISGANRRKFEFVCEKSEGFSAQSFEFIDNLIQADLS